MAGKEDEFFFFFFFLECRVEKKKKKNLFFFSKQVKNPFLPQTAASGPCSGPAPPTRSAARSS